MQSGPALSSPRSYRLILVMLNWFGDDEVIDTGDGRIVTRERSRDLQPTRSRGPDNESKGR
jgi:hypothetical protein